MTYTLDDIYSQLNEIKLMMAENDSSGGEGKNAEGLYASAIGSAGRAGGSKIVNLINNINTALENTKSNLKGIYGHVQHMIEPWAKADEAASKYAKTIAMTAEGMKKLRKTAIENVVSQKIGIYYNVSTDELLKIQNDYAKAVGRGIRVDDTQQESLAAMHAVMNGKEIELAAAFENFGVSLNGVADHAGKMFADASKNGLSFEKYSDNVAKNIKIAQNYTFKNGLKGLESMAKKATAIKLDMGQVASFAEKVSTIEGAIDVASKLQVLGGSFAGIADPLGMLNEGLMDMEGLTDRVIKMIGGMGAFNKQTGEVEVSAFNKQRIKAAAQAMGMDYSQLMESVNAGAKREEITRQISASANATGLNNDMKELLKNSASFNEEGKAGVSINGQFKTLDELTNEDYDDLVKETQDQAADIKDIAKDLRSIKDMEEGTKKQYEANKARMAQRWGLGSAVKGIVGAVGAWNLLLRAVAHGSWIKSIFGMIGNGANLIGGWKNIFSGKRWRGDKSIFANRIGGRGFGGGGSDGSIFDMFNNFGGKNGKFGKIFDNLGKKFGGKFGKLFNRFGGIGGKISGIFSKFGGKFGGIFSKLGGKFGGIIGKFGGIVGKFGGIGGKFGSIIGKFGGITGKFSGVAGKFGNKIGAKLISQLSSKAGGKVLTTAAGKTFTVAANGVMRNASGKIIAGAARQKVLQSAGKVAGKQLLGKAVSGGGIGTALGIVGAIGNIKTDMDVESGKIEKGSAKHMRKKAGYSALEGAGMGIGAAALAGMASAAAGGSAVGPIGTAIGAVAGALIGATVGVVKVVKARREKKVDEKLERMGIERKGSYGARSYKLINRALESGEISNRMRRKLEKKGDYDMLEAIDKKKKEKDEKKRKDRNERLAAIFGGRGGNIAKGTFTVTNAYFNGDAFGGTNIERKGEYSEEENKAIDEALKSGKISEELKQKLTESGDEEILKAIEKRKENPTEGNGIMAQRNKFGVANFEIGVANFSKLGSIRDTRREKRKENIQKMKVGMKAGFGASELMAGLLTFNPLAIYGGIKKIKSAKKKREELKAAKESGISNIKGLPEEGFSSELAGLKKSAELFGQKKGEEINQPQSESQNSLNGGKIDLNISGTIKLEGANGKQVDITKDLLKDGNFIREITKLITRQIGENQVGSNRQDNNNMARTI